MNLKQSFEKISEETINYYNENGPEFFSDTVNLDLSSLYNPFIELLLPGGHILDAGCGSGRDSLYFKHHGFLVTAFDGSEKMVEYATRTTGLPVKKMNFQNVNFSNCFDGIWACASLLHIQKNQIDDVFDRLSNSLVPGGLLYASFRYGNNEVINNGRLFNNYDEFTVKELISRHKELILERLWITFDIRSNKRKIEWLNIILKKHIS